MRCVDIPLTPREEYDLFEPEVESRDFRHGVSLAAGVYRSHSRADRGVSEDKESRKGVVVPDDDGE